MKAKSGVLLAILALIWGSSFILIKKGLVVFSPIELGAIRLSLAAICLFPITIRAFKKIPRSAWKYLVLVGLLGNGIPAFLFAAAEQVVPSAIAGILNSLTPLFTLLIALVIFKKRFSSAKITGILLGLVGAVIIGLSGEEAFSSKGNLQFSLLIVLATICYGASTNIIKTFLSDMSPLYITSFALSMVGFPALIYISLRVDFWQKSVTADAFWPAFGAIFLLAAIGTALALVLFNRLLQLTDQVRAASVTYFIPIVALGWGLWDGEVLGLFHFIGMAIVLVSIYLVNRKEQKTIVSSEPIK